MIRRLHLKNFKCFDDAEISFAKLNIFAGANGTGKSTVVQALLVLFQSIQSGAIQRGRLLLNGSLIELGTDRDVRYKRSEADTFEIVLQDDDGLWTVIASPGSKEPQHVLQVALDPRDPIRSLKNRLLYLSADRLAPQKSYPMSLDDARGNDIGSRGEYAPLLYGQTRDENVANAHLLLETPEKQRYANLETQFTLWMSRLFPGFQARTDDLDHLDTVTLGLNLQKQIGEPQFLRPGNVGFGVSVVFPIVLAGLLADASTTLIIENPEAHLHPSAQSLVGEFLARVAASGCQLFVETHSDHVVNGMRVAFKNNVVSAHDLKFFAFTRTDTYGSHRITPIELDSSGDFSVHPDTFFDQTDKDLKLIYDVR
jgi:predicted ATPase